MTGNLWVKRAIASSSSALVSWFFGGCRSLDVHRWYALGGPNRTVCRELYNTGGNVRRVHNHSGRNCCDRRVGLGRGRLDRVNPAVEISPCCLRSQGDFLCGGYLLPWCAGS